MNHIDFDAIEWSSPMPHLRHKVYERDGRRLRLMEMDREFVEPGWCMTGHIGYVLEGKMDITFADGTKTISQGGGIFLRGALTLADSTVSGNSATNGGGLYIIWSGSPIYPHGATLYDSIVNGTSASSEGRGIWSAAPLAR